MEIIAGCQYYLKNSYLFIQNLIIIYINLIKNVNRKIKKIFYKSLINSSPEKLITNKLTFKKKSIFYNKKKIFSFKNKFYIISIGKASQSLIKGILSSSKNIEDYFVVRHFFIKKNNINIKKTFRSTHPLVSKKSYNAAKKIIQFINQFLQMLM